MKEESWRKKKPRENAKPSWNRVGSVSTILRWIWVAVCRGEQQWVCHMFGRVWGWCRWRGRAIT